MSFTPGPWHVWLRNNNGMLHVGPPPHSVAWIINVDDEQANAQLIAAAPELLAFVRECAGDDLERVSGGLRAKARDLLAKAIGAAGTDPAS